MINEAAKSAAQWWADQLRRPPKMDNGADRVTAVLVHLMQAQKAVIIPDEKIKVFQAALERRIIDEWKSNDQCTVLVVVDYEANDILKASAEESGIELKIGTLPWKTITWVNPSQVELRHGYGAETKKIFEARVHD